MRLLFSLIGILLSFSLLQAQKIEIEIADKPEKGVGFYTIGDIDGVRYVCATKAVVTEFSYFLLKIDPKTLAVKKEIKLEFERMKNKIGTDKAIPYKTPFSPIIYIYNEHLYCLYQTDAGPQLQRMDTNGKLLGTPFTVNEKYDLQNSYTTVTFDESSGYFFVANTEKDAINVAPFKWKKSYTFSYTVLDTEFKVINSFEHEFKKGVLNAFCDLDGNIHLAVAKETEMAYTEIEIYTKNRIENKLEATSLGVDIPISRYIVGNYNDPIDLQNSGIVVQNEEGDIEFIGLVYKKIDKKDLCLTGYYRIKYDIVSKEVKAQFKDFPVYDYSLILKGNKRKPLTHLPGDFKMTFIRLLPNGECIIIGNFVEFDASANMTIYSTVMAFSIDKNGNIKWNHFIPKKQMSILVGGGGMIKMSHTPLMTFGLDDYTILIFSDHKDNLKATDYSTIEELKTPKDAILCYVIIDKDGKISAKTKVENINEVAINQGIMSLSKDGKTINGTCYVGKATGYPTIKMVEINFKSN